MRAGGRGPSQANCRKVKPKYEERQLSIIYKRFTMY